MAFEQFKLLRPLYLLSLSLLFLPLVVAKLTLTLQLSKLLRWASLQDAWFGRFWIFFGPRARDNAAPTVGPLMQSAKGIVLDVGPGSGQWLYLYSPRRNPNITKVYGVEPNLEHHPALHQTIKREGLQDIYEVVGVGAEDLQSVGIKPASVDTIVTLQVLCSVPTPQRIVTELYAYLKPGGQWIVYEHVKTKFNHEFVSTWQCKKPTPVPAVLRTTTSAHQTQLSSMSFGPRALVAAQSLVPRMNISLVLVIGQMSISILVRMKGDSTRFPMPWVVSGSEAPCPRF